MKRILVFTTWYPTPEEPHLSTYVSQQVKIIKRHLSETTEECQVVVWHQQQSLDLTGLYFHRKTLKNADWDDEGVPVLRRHGLILSHRWKNPQYFLLHRGMMKTYQQVTELLQGAPEVVWTVTMAGALRWHEFSEKCKLKLPFVLQEHSNTIWMHLKSRASVMRAPKMLTQAAGIVVVAERQIEQFKNLEPTVEPVVIWNAVDPAYLQPCTEKPEGRRILFVGRLSAEKGLGRLIKAIPLVIKFFPDLVVELIGKGPEQKLLEDEIASLGVKNHVKFWGVKKPEEIALVLDQAAVFVLPSEYENCPVALLEAQTRGVPCVVRNNNASEKVLLPGNGVGVDDDGNGHGIAAGLFKVLEQLEKYDRREIQKRSLQQFSPDVFAQKMCDVFKRACV